MDMYKVNMLQVAKTRFQTLTYKAKSGRISKINIQRIVAIEPQYKTILVHKTGVGYRRLKIDGIQAFSANKMGTLKLG